MASLILRRADVQRAAEYEREAEHIVDLIRIVGAPGGDDGVGACRLSVLGRYLRIRVRKRHNQRLRRHALRVLFREDTRGGEPEENVGAFDDIAESARLGLNGELRLPLVHFLLPSLVDDAVDVGNDDVLLSYSHAEQLTQAGERRRARARADDLHVLGPLPHQPQGVHDRRTYDDGGAVLIVVENRDRHALPESSLDLETLRCLDVLEVDTAEGGLETRDDLHEGVDVRLVHLDIEHVDTGELLEQNRLALHHGLGRQRTDGAETQHRGAVADDADQVAPGGQVGSLPGLRLDRVAGGRDAGRIRQREVLLGAQRLGSGDGQLPRHRITVVI